MRNTIELDRPLGRVQAGFLIKDTVNKEVHEFSLPFHCVPLTWFKSPLLGRSESSLISVFIEPVRRARHVQGHLPPPPPQTVNRVFVEGTDTVMASIAHASIERLYIGALPPKAVLNTGISVDLLEYSCKTPSPVPFLNALCSAKRVHCAFIRHFRNRLWTTIDKCCLMHMLACTVN